MRKGKVTAVVAVRKGSQRVPNKNIKPFGDTTLLDLKLQTLLKVSNIDEIIVALGKKGLDAKVSKGILQSFLQAMSSYRFNQQIRIRPTYETELVVAIDQKLAIRCHFITQGYLPKRWLEKIHATGNSRHHQKVDIL